jgi:diguanylate cyclase (GGDEF)-like protein
VDHTQLSTENVLIARRVKHPLARRWQNLRLQTKTIAMIVTAMISGCAAGIVAAMHPLGVFALLGGMTGSLALLLWFGKRYVWGPYEQFVITAQQLTHEDHPTSIESLPLIRRDELGNIARAMQQLSSWANRDHREAHLIRKNLDHRIEKSTRQATFKLQRIAMRDALTDLGNRHFLDINLETLVTSVRESGDDLICIVIDLDNFKQINDTLGHATGDDVLILMGSLVRACIRTSDLAVRLGGDEFVILLPCCDMQQAATLSHRISSLFNQHMRTTLKTQLPVSLSIGIASLCQEEAQTGAELLDIADRKLYEAKRGGKAQAVGA